MVLSLRADRYNKIELVPGSY